MTLLSRGGAGGGSSNYLFVNGEGNCFKVTFMPGWHLSCKAESKSTHRGILSSSGGSSGSKSSSDTLKIKTKDSNNKNKKSLARQVQTRSRTEAWTCPEFILEGLSVGFPVPPEFSQCGHHLEDVGVGMERKVGKGFVCWHKENWGSKCRSKELVSYALPVAFSPFI